MPETTKEPGRTIVVGDRELAIGFRLIGLKDVVEVTPQNSVAEFEKAMSGGYTLVIATQSIRALLSETQRAAADASLHPLVVFVPTPSGEYEVESIEALAKRILGVTLTVAS
ncbi:MAG TPA: V-type ATP synthase subunit F [Thermoplasmata archaeon]|nr:V-type ATP synthase subunit F [Thermoplasmata archaeon]HYB77078.1 V-type ATP synthase subunit F [Thermoplasmata archaeon]